MYSDTQTDENEARSREGLHQFLQNSNVFVILQATSRSVHLYLW